MDEQTALHTAARRYCRERFDEWARTYTDLERNGKAQVEKPSELPSWTYSDEAYRTFPRYRIAKDTQVEVERLVPATAASLDELRTALIVAAEKAHTGLQTELKNELAESALREELEGFRAFVMELMSDDLRQVKELPYRRVLNETDSKRLWSGLKEAWGVGGGYWFPLKEGNPPAHVLPFHVEYFKSINGVSVLREALKARGVSRVFLLCEFAGDPEYEIDLAIYSPGYGEGGEQYSTSKDLGWMVYASHESSITICGEWLTELFRRLHPECSERTYKGPFSTADLRGTLEAK